MQLPAGEAFEAIYLSLIGKRSGPRAGFLVVSQSEDLVKARFLQAAQ